MGTYSDRQFQCEDFFNLAVFQASLSNIQIVSFRFHAIMGGNFTDMPGVMGGTDPFQVIYKFEILKSVQAADRSGNDKSPARYMAARIRIAVRNVHLRRGKQTGRLLHLPVLKNQLYMFSLFDIGTDNRCYLHHIDSLPFF